MIFPKRAGTGLALACGIALGAAQAQPEWMHLDGPSPGPVQSIVSVDSVLLIYGSQKIFRASGPEGPWKSSPFPVGYEPWEFMQTVDSLVFAFDGTTLLRSADRGLTWVRTAGTDVAMPRRIFRSRGSLAMVARDGRYFSSADGLTWTGYGTSPSGYAYCHLLFQDSLLFAGTDAGLYVSADHGGTWKRSRSGLPDGQIVLLERMQGKLFLAVAGGGLFASSNLGATWSKVDGGLAKAGTEYASDMGMAAGRDLLLLSTYGPGGVLGSRDSGKTWTPLNRGLPAFNEGGTTRYVTFHVVFQDDTAFVSTSGGVYRSTNGGAQWNAVNQGLPLPDNAFLSLSAAGGDLYAADFVEESGPAYRSRDGGRTWKRADTLLDGMRLMRAEGNDWFASTDRGLRRSTDGGRTWVSVPGPWPLPSQGAAVFDLRGADLAVANLNGGASLFYSPDTGATWSVETDSRPSARLGDLRFQAAANRLRVSADAGRTWNYLAAFFPDTVTALQAGNGSMALLSGSKLYVSADSGRTWKRPGGLPDPLPVNSIAQAGSRLYAATAKGLMLSSDGGTQWKTLGQGLPVEDIQALAASEGRLYAADYQGLHVREGTSPAWSTLDSAPVHIRRLAAWKDILLAATQENRIWISRDAGESWQLTGDNVSAESIYSMAWGSSLGFLSRPSGLCRTSDSGKTWERLPLTVPMQPPAAMAQGGADLYAIADLSIYRSADAGAAWTRQSVPEHWAPTLLAAEGGGLYGSDGITVFSSRDQGVGWNPVSPSFPIRPIAQLAYANGRVYVAGERGKGIYVLETAASGIRGSARRIPADGFRLDARGGAAAFRFDLVGNSQVTLGVYSASGRRIARISRRLGPGAHAVPWNPPGGHAGLFYRAEIRPDDPARAALIRAGRLAP